MSGLGLRRAAMRSYIALVSGVASVGSLGAYGIRMLAVLASQVSLLALLLRILTPRMKLMSTMEERERFHRRIVSKEEYLPIGLRLGNGCKRMLAVAEELRISQFHC